MNVDAGRADVGEGRDELKIVAEPGGLQIFDRGLGNGVNPGAGGERSGLVDPRSAQHVGAGALHIFEVIGVIDDPGGVGILEIDGQGEVVLRPDEAAAIGLVEGMRRHDAGFSRPRLIAATPARLTSAMRLIRSPWASAMSLRCIPQPGR